MNKHGPPKPSSRLATSMRSSAIKRDSLQADLERDPQLSTAKRQQRSQALSSHMATASLERQLLTAQTARAEMESKLREKDALIEKLERDRRWLAEREKAANEEKDMGRAEYDESKRKHEHELRVLRNSKAALQQQHAELEDAHSALSRKSSQTIATLKSQLSQQTKQYTSIETKTAELAQLAEERGKMIRRLQEKIEELTEKEKNSTKEVSDSHNWSVVREELQRQAEYLRKLETTNAKQNAELISLRDRQTSVEVLREEKRSLENKLRDFDQMRDQVHMLEAELETCRRDRDEWEDKVANMSTFIPDDEEVAELRSAHTQLLEENSATIALLRSRDEELADVKEKNEALRSSLDGLQDKLRLEKERSTRHEHATALASREVSFLKALVASFSAEEASSGTVQVDTVKSRQIEELEALVEEHKSMNQTLQKELDAHTSEAMEYGAGRPRKEIVEELERLRKQATEAETALKEAETSIEGYEERIDELEQELHDLQGDVISGNHLPPGVRVLSMKENPAQQWADLSKAAMDQLRGENQALLERLAELEKNGVRSEGSSDRTDLVPRESWEILKQEKETLESTVKDKEKRLLRLQQVFGAKSAEFREAIASILGLKLAFYPNGQVRVTSIFDLDASFIFQPTSQHHSSDGAGGDGMKMQLVAQGEGGPQDLPQMMYHWVEKEQCIPGFMASVTLECYDKMKREEALAEEE